SETALSSARGVPSMPRRAVASALSGFDSNGAGEASSALAVAGAASIAAIVRISLNAGRARRSSIRAASGVFVDGCVGGGDIRKSYRISPDLAPVTSGPAIAGPHGAGLDYSGRRFRYRCAEGAMDSTSTDNWLETREGALLFRRSWVRDSATAGV